MKIVRLMAVVAIIALDLGLLLNRFFGANPFQLLTVIVIEVGLSRSFLRERSPRRRAWWFGFAALGSAYVALDAVFHYEIRVAIAWSYWRVANTWLPSWGLPQGPIPHGLLAAGIQVTAAPVAASLGGFLGRSLGVRLARCGRTRRQVSQLCGKPWRRISGSAEGGPSAT